MSLEKLEPRLALAGDVSRPLLERATNLYMDPSMHGPQPVIMSKSQVVGNDVKSFVISRVPAGSVVEKLDTATNTWVDVSTKPTSSNPRELLRLLKNRLIQQGDSLRWTPKAGVESSVQQAFEMIGWDDGSELLGVSAEAPSAVQNLEVSPTGVGELTVTWEAPATGDATSYSITMTTEAGTGNSSTTYVTSATDYKFTELSPANGYKFSVTASNADGTSPAAEDSFGQALIHVLGWPSYSSLTTGLDGSIWVSMAITETVQQIVNDDGVWKAQVAIPIRVGTRPNAITTGLDGSIWVANFGSNTVQQITNDNGVWKAQAAIALGHAPTALTTGLDGSIWVATGGGGTTKQFVQQITNDNGVWTPQGTINVGDSRTVFVSALTTGLDGSVWVANNGDHTVQQITNDNGVWTAQAAINVGKLPRALTTGLDGSIWVAFCTGTWSLLGINNGIQQIVKDNGVWTAQAAIDVGIEPVALTTGLDGSIWVANRGSSTVQQIVNNNGVWTPQAAINVINGGLTLTTGQDGSIWVANRTTTKNTPFIGTVGTIQQIAAPPNAPSDLAAVFGAGPGEMTLAWQPPAIDGGTPVISYTATVSQGTYTKTITTSDTSCVFDGLTLGSGLTYFTVTATNFAGEGRPAALQIDASGNTIPQFHRGFGITTEGVPATNGGFDGFGNTYSWEAMGDTSAGGALVGTSLVSGGLSVDVSPNQPDFTKAAGQDIEATGSGGVLTLAAAAVNGSQGFQTLTLNFDDGTTATWTQSFSDWCDPFGYPNESILSTQSYRNTASGGTNDTTNYIYSYGYTLPEGKTLESITLPNNSNIRILGATLSDPTVVDLTENWNAYGLVVANNQVPNGQGFDGHGNYYNAGGYGGSALGYQTASSTSQNTDDFLYQTITWGGATFNLGPAPSHYSQSNNRDGNDNFVQANGQTIDLQSGDFSKVLMIGAGANGNQTDQEFTLKFTDGSTATWTQSFTDWANDNGNKHNSPPSGSTLASTNEALVATTSWVNQLGNNQPKYNRFVYGYSFDIPAGKTLESITLPNNSDVGILGMALIPAPSVPTSAPQNLTATPVSINGLDIAWSRPEEVSGGSGTQITYEVTVVQGTLSYTEDTTATTLSLPQGLLLGNPYTVTVLPKTQYGDGTPASLTQVYPV
jgi:hypothetical protein